MQKGLRYLGDPDELTRMILHWIHGRGTVMLPSQYLCDFYFPPHLASGHLEPLAFHPWVLCGEFCAAPLPMTCLCPTTVSVCLMEGPVVQASLRLPAQASGTSLQCSPSGDNSSHLRHCYHASTPHSGLCSEISRANSMPVTQIFSFHVWSNASQALSKFPVTDALLSPILPLYPPYLADPAASLFQNHLICLHRDPIRFAPAV